MAAGESVRRSLIVDYNRKTRLGGVENMRVNVGLITALCVAFVYQTALADDPPAPPQPAQAAAPAEQSAAPAGEQKNAATPAPQPSAAAAAPAIKPGLTVSTAKPELTPADKELLARGYKLEMRHGEKYFCRSETPIESRFPIKSCDTAESIESHRQESQEAVRQIESNRSRVSN
jgi:hypothetical protein